MRLRIEDHFIEVERPGRREQKIKIFEGLSEKEALHGIGFLFRNDALQRGIAFVVPAVFDEVSEHHRAHLEVVIRIELLTRFV